MPERRRTETWIIASRCGDQAAVAKLLAALHPRLRARAASRLDRATQVRTSPDDILQEVYVQVFRQSDRFEHPNLRTFRHWVFTILDHKIIDAYRAAYRCKRDAAREIHPAPGGGSSSYFSLLDHLYADSDTPSRVVRKREAVEALQRCLAKLSDTHRRVIQMRFLDGLPLGEVASRLDKSEQAVVALSRRALDQLRATMDRLGEYTGGL